MNTEKNEVNSSYTVILNRADHFKILIAKRRKVLFIFFIFETDGTLTPNNPPTSEYILKDNTTTVKLKW